MKRTKDKKQSTRERLLSQAEKAMRGLRAAGLTGEDSWSEDPFRSAADRAFDALGKVTFLARISGLKDIGHPKETPIREPLFSKTGLVKVRPCGDGYGGKTYVGFLIGDVGLSSSVAIENDKIVCSWAHYNPGIFVPELGKVIYGCESWWSKIKSVEDLTEITKTDINSVWYVQLFEAMTAASETTR